MRKRGKNIQVERLKWGLIYREREREKERERERERERLVLASTFLGL